MRSSYVSIGNSDSIYITDSIMIHQETIVKQTTYCYHVYIVFESKVVVLVVRPHALPTDDHRSDFGATEVQ
jgi:hypothetical protein